MGTLGDINIFSTTGTISTKSEAGNIEILATAGDIDTEATAGNISTTAVKGDIKFVSDLGNVEIEAGTKDVLITSTTKTNISSAQVIVDATTAVNLGKEKADEPILLGKKFLEEFVNHTHPSGSGPTGIVQNGSQFTQTLSKKVFGS